MIQKSSIQIEEYQTAPLLPFYFGLLPGPDEYFIAQHEKARGNNNKPSPTQA
jgi:hypothetical protein